MFTLSESRYLSPEEDSSSGVNELVRVNCHSGSTTSLFCVLYILITDNRDWRPLKMPVPDSQEGACVFCFNSCGKTLLQPRSESYYVEVWPLEFADVPDSWHPVRTMRNLWQMRNYRGLLTISPLSPPPSSHTLLTQMAIRRCQWWSMGSWELVGFRACQLSITLI